MNYPQTVLEAMMYYPTLFPNELSVQVNLFLHGGTGFDWNSEGELVCRFSPRGTIERTEESIIGGCNEKDYEDNKILITNGYPPTVFSSCGCDNTFYIYPHTGAYNLMGPLRGNVEPTNSWKYGIWEFCNNILKPDAKVYKQMLKTRSWDNPMYLTPDWIKTDMKSFRDLQKVCKKLKEKYEKAALQVYLTRIESILGIEAPRQTTKMTNGQTPEEYVKSQLQKALTQK